MAKYIDENGAEQLNQLLAVKFDTKVDKVLATKTYTGIQGSGTNNNANYAFYYMSIKPKSYTEPWSIRYRIHVWVPGHTDFDALSEGYLAGDKSSCNNYAFLNHIYNTSYRPVYYQTLYKLTETGFNSGYGHAVAMSMADSNERTTSGYARSFTVEVLSTMNCEVELVDTPVKWANWPGTGSTNYTDITSYNFYNSGLQETGDANDTTTLYAYDKTPVGANGLYGRNICTYTSDMKIEGFVNSYSTGNTKTKNTSSFKIGAPFYYYNSTTNKASGELAGDGTLASQISTINARYSTNCGANGLTINKPLYLVGVPNGDTFTLANTWWTQDLPTTADGNIYIYLGIAYNTETIDWQTIHPIFEYKNGGIRLYRMPLSSGDVTTALGYTPGTYSKPSGGIPATDLASAVQTSLVQTLPSDTNVNVWSLDTGVYKVNDGSNYFFYDNGDNTKKTQLNSEGLLIVKNEDDIVRYTLYKGKFILKGTVDIEYPEDTTYEITTCQSVQNKVTALSSSSTDTQYPSAKCVYDNLALKQNQVTASTTDLTPGTSPLATGELYVVYE